jgi:hypothetical protein
MRGREPVRTREKPSRNGAGLHSQILTTPAQAVWPARAERIPEVNGCACAGPNPLIWVTLAHPGER